MMKKNENGWTAIASSKQKCFENLDGLAQSQLTCKSHLPLDALCVHRVTRLVQKKKKKKKRKEKMYAAEKKRNGKVQTPSILQSSLCRLASQLEHQTLERMKQREEKKKKQKLPELETLFVLQFQRAQQRTKQKQATKTEKKKKKKEAQLK